MALLLVFVYHVILLGTLAVASGSLSIVELFGALALLGLGAAALIDTELVLEPRRPRPGHHAVG